MALHLAKTHVQIEDESFAVGSLWDPLAGQEAAGSPQDSAFEVSTDPDDLFLASNRYLYQSFEHFQAKCEYEADHEALRRVWEAEREAGESHDMYLKMARLGLSEQGGSSPIRAGVQVYDEASECLTWYTA